MVLLKRVPAAALTMCTLALAAGLIGHAAPMPAIQDAQSKVVEALHAEGVKSERARVVVWFDPAELSRADADRLTDAISSGMSDIENMLGLTFDSTEKLEFFVTSEFGVTAITTLSPRRVFLPLERVRERRAPFIHEAVHHLVYQRATTFREDVHLWVIEGFANYVQAALAEKSDYLREHPMNPANSRVDDEARRILSTPAGVELVEWVGRSGIPPRLEDREHVARPFYVLSQSLTKYVIEVVGLRAFAARAVPLLSDGQAFAKFVNESAGKPLEQVRREWLARGHAAQ
jgi:hypothetical protein